MDNDKEKQEISLIGRIFSLEALLILMGLLSLVSGIIYGDWIRIFIGVLVMIGGYLLLVYLRKKYLRKE